jgi:integrase
LNGGENYPDCVRWIRTPKNKSNKLPEELLNVEEVKLLLQNADNLRDKALIASLWESGARIGELGTREIRHVSFDDFGCQVMLEGKTGQRRIRLVSSAPYLLEWINHHPQNKNPSAPLWPTIHHHFEKPMHWRFIYNMLCNTAKKAGITKPINPHHFRHSRATYMAQFLTAAQMKEYFGWTQDSDMAARYVHLSGKQVDDAILKMYGLKKEEEKKDVLQRQPCPRCKNPNDVNSNYCEKCWLPLTPQAVSEVEEIRQKDQEGMVAVMKLLEMEKTNPGILKEAVVRALQVRR